VDERIRAGLGAAAEKAELRKFGLIVGAGFGIVFGFLGPWLRHHPIPIWPWLLCAVLVGAGLVIPRALHYPNLGWQRLGRALGKVNSLIILNLLFYLVILPTGAMARIFGWDPMNRKFDRELRSYRVAAQPVAPRSMERPY
jgi:hypothetical protein